MRGDGMSMDGWTKTLTKKEKKHLRENGIRSTIALEHHMEHVCKSHQAWVNKEPNVVCWDCVSIARKLGVIE